MESTGATINTVPSNDTQYLTIAAAASALKIDEAALLHLHERGEISLLCVRDDDLRVPRADIETHLLRRSSQAPLVLREEGSAPEQQRLSHQIRKELFCKRTQKTPEEYLHAWRAGELDVLQSGNVELTLEAEELLNEAREQRRSEGELSADEGFLSVDSCQPNRAASDHRSDPIPTILPLAT